ncbi:hypothetical protein D3C73_580040 [compost metagenome]
MIVRETDPYFVMTTQHDHAEFSSKVASYFAESLLGESKYSSDVLFAIQQHDRGWIRLDDTPIWNDRNNVPFSFIDFPLLPKLILYKKGLDEVEEMNDYAALICSLHYSAFKHIQRSQITDCIDFIRHEAERQNRLKAQLDYPDEEMIVRHFRLLQLCDEISLYVCMNNPGVIKENEHPWYREGFEIMIDDQKIHAHWMSENEIVISPFIFKSEVTATTKSKHVPKELIKRVGIAADYIETDWTEQEVIFVNS